MKERMIDVRTGFVRGGAGSLARNAPGVAALVLLSAASAAEARQVGPMSAAPVEQKWVMRETWPGAVGAQADEAVDVAMWDDPNTPPGDYVFATGWVTESGGTTRFLTVRYDVRNPTILPLKAYWPPEGQSASGIHKAVALAVNPLNGDVYVTGHVPQVGDVNAKDYFVIKYDNLLVEQWAAPVRYNGPAGGDDIPADIVFIGTVPPAANAGAAVVTGTSWGGAADKNDIVTLALCEANGSFCEAWDGASEATGIARFDGGYLGDDIAVELTNGASVINDPEGDCPCSGSEAAIHVAVLGTSWGGAVEKNDIVAVRSAGDGSVNPPLGGAWTHRYQGLSGSDQVASGFVGFIGGHFFACGYGPSGASGQDYILLVYQDFDLLSPRLVASEVRDFNGGDDFATDVQIGPVQGATRVWITGRAANGGTFDFGTTRYTYPDPLPLVFDWKSSYGPVAGRDDRAAALALHDSLTVGDHDGFVAGMSAGVSVTNYDAMAVRYLPEPPSPNRPPLWSILYPGFGGHDAAKAIAAARFSDPVTEPIRVNLFVAGTSFKTGQGQDFTLIRYKQNIP